MMTVNIINVHIYIYKDSIIIIITHTQTARDAWVKDYLQPWLAKNGHVMCTPAEAMPLKEAYIRLHANVVSKDMKQAAQALSQWFSHNR